MTECGVKLISLFIVLLIRKVYECGIQVESRSLLSRLERDIVVSWSPYTRNSVGCQVFICTRYNVFLLPLHSERVVLYILRTSDIVIGFDTSYLPCVVGSCVLSLTCDLQG